MPASVKSLVSQLKRTWWFAWAATVMLALSHLKDVADGIEKALILCGLKPDSLAIAESVERGVFAREFSEVSWRRLFWARAVVGRVEAKWKTDDVAEAYKAYTAATETWYTKMMIFIVYTERLHGTKKALELDQSVSVAMNDVSKNVSNIRVAENLTGEDFKKAHESIDKANDALFHFVRGFSKSGSTR